MPFDIKFPKYLCSSKVQFEQEDMIAEIRRVSLFSYSGIMCS
jgi:hypothetical protein